VNWRDLPPIPDETWELEKPFAVSEAGGPNKGGSITLVFNDQLSRQWWAEYLRTKKAYETFGTWVDERR
jgi:hypothetical protein